MTTTTQTTNKPLLSAKDGVIQITVWENPTKDGNGSFRSLDITRRYKAKDGSWKDSRTFSVRDFDRLMTLAGQVHQELAILDGTHPDPDAYR